MTEAIDLQGNWLIKAPLSEVFDTLTDAEHQLRVVARPLIGRFSMRYWEKAVIDELRARLER